MKKEMTQLQAFKDFFGLKPGQDNQGFFAEVKALTPADREELKAGLEQNGYTIIGTPVVKKAA